MKDDTQPKADLFKDFKYEVVKPGEHPRLAVIRKSNISEEWTVQEVQKQVEDLIKGKLIFANQKTLAESFMTNIAANHPEIVSFLNSLDGAKFAAVSLFCEHKKKLDVAQSNIDQFDKAIAVYRDEIEHVAKVTGLDFSVSKDALPTDALKKDEPASTGPAIEPKQ